MMKAFDTATDKVAFWLGHPLAVVLTMMAFFFLMAIVGVDVTNIVLSVVSLILLLILQHTQNRDGLALQAKLDELIRSSEAQDRYIGLDREPEDKIREVRDGPV